MSDMPEQLTTEELRELDDLEAWIRGVFEWAGMRPSDARLEHMAECIRGPEAELSDEARERIWGAVMTEARKDRG